jgi:hypothetical protein
LACSYRRSSPRASLFDFIDQPLRGKPALRTVHGIARDEEQRPRAFMTSLAVVALSLAAFSALCMAMTRHHETPAWLGGKTGSASVALLRAAGGVGLIAGVWLAVRANGIGVGLVLWCGALTLAAIGVVLCMTYRPRRLRLLGAAAGACGIATAAMSGQGGV